MTPQELSALIDEWGVSRMQRLAMQRDVDRMEEVEKKLKAQIITALAKGDLTSAGGKCYGANYKRKEKPTAGDWSKIYGWIKETDSFDILQKRLTDTAIEARRQDGIIIPGIVMYPVDDITMFTI